MLHVMNVKQLWMNSVMMMIGSPMMRHGKQKMKKIRILKKILQEKRRKDKQIPTMFMNATGKCERQLVNSEQLQGDFDQKQDVGGEQSDEDIQDVDHLEGKGIQ